MRASKATKHLEEELAEARNVEEKFNEEHIKATEVLEACQQEYQEQLAHRPTAAPETPRPEEEEPQGVDKNKPWGNRRNPPTTQPAPKGGIDDEEGMDLDHLQDYINNLEAEHEKA
eukprot:13026967-Heterocapsa_arctica.AAC.1